MPALAAPVIDLALPRPRRGGPIGIATLGPAGTSSEQSAGYLADYLRVGWRGAPAPLPSVSLHPRYEDAAEAVLSGRSDLLLVANAYHAASTFYMSPRLRFAGAFLFDTPLYGIATPDGRLPGGRFPAAEFRIATHPAPIPLIDQVLGGTGVDAWTVVLADSTSAAALAVTRGEVDAALTTAPAAALHGLVFATRARPIRMLWSVFSCSRTPDEAAAEIGCES